MKSEEKIIKQCLKGKQSAYKDLYELYKDYCFTICVRYGIPQNDIKDCMQVIFTQIFTSLKSYNSQKAQFKTWLSRVTINQILMQKRKNKINYLSLEKTLLEAADSHTSRSLDAKMDCETIYDILSKMPKQYITVFNLYIIDGYNHKEIAEQLDITEGASRTLLHRGRKWAMKELNFLNPESKMAISKAL